MAVPRHPKPAGCSGCALNGGIAQSLGYAPAVGNPNAPLLFVGEALGEREVYSGEPFSGDAGGLLGVMLRRSSLARESIRIDNCVRCQPPGNWLDGAPWRHAALNHCSQYLTQTIGESQNAHKVIVTLGAVALRHVLGLSGEGIAVKDFHGTVHRLPSGQFVVPTFHPSHLQRGAINLLDVVRFDIDRAQDVARNGWTPQPVSIVQDPSLEWFAAWVGRYLLAAEGDNGVWLAVDCETPDKAGGRDEGELTPDDQSSVILRSNFSCHPDEGVTVPHQGPYLALIAKLLASPGVKVLWNKNYDRKRYLLNNFVCGGEWWDLMWAAHRLQSDIPRGLGFWAPFASDFGAWKHLARITGREAEYAAIDGFQTLRLAHYIVKHLVEQRMWDVFERHTHRLEEDVLRPAYELGLAIDIPALDAFHEHLDLVCGEQLNKVKAREAAGTLKPKNGYKTKPKGKPCAALSKGEDSPGHAGCASCNGTGFTQPQPPAGILGKKKGKTATAKDAYIEGSVLLVERREMAEVRCCRTCEGENVGPKHRCPAPKRRRGATKDGTESAVRDTLRDAELVFLPREQTRYYWHLPFNPDSPSQLLKYIADTGHQAGRAKKTRKPTSNADTLRRLAKTTSDPIYQFILDYRAVKKVDSTYALGVKKRIWADGRIHSEYTFKPSTGRLSYQNPNLTNVIADKQGAASLAAGFRRCIVASPGCRLLEVDFSAIEAVETGWYLNDPAVMRLAKLGIHAYLTSYLIGKPADLSWADADLSTYFAHIKEHFPQDYDRAKRCVHGKNYGLTIYGMCENFPKDYPDLKTAQRVEDMYYTLVPGLPAWHRQLQLTAKRQGYLGGYGVHPFAYKHHFFGVESLRRIDQAEAMRLKSRNSPNLQLIDGRPYKRSLGEDSKRVIAFFPQSTAAGVLIESMLQLFTPGAPAYIGEAYYGRTPLRGPIHDSLLLEVPVAAWDTVVSKVVSTMQAPILQQACPPAWNQGPYLSIGVAAKASGDGGNWQEMTKVDIAGIHQAPEAAREQMYSPVDEEELEDVQDLQTIITAAATGQGLSGGA